MGACVITLEEHTKLDCKDFWWVLFGRKNNPLGFFLPWNGLIGEDLFFKISSVNHTDTTMCNSLNL
jgi:hypothetical protein